MWITAFLFLILVIGDQVSKYFAMMIDPKNPIEIGSFVKFQLVYNRGAAFGLGENFAWILVVISGVASDYEGKVQFTSSNTSSTTVFSANKA